MFSCLVLKPLEFSKKTLQIELYEESKKLICSFQTKLSSVPFDDMNHFSESNPNTKFVLEYDILIKNERILYKTPELENFLTQELERREIDEANFRLDLEEADEKDEKEWDLEEEEEEEKVEIAPLRILPKKDSLNSMILSEDSPNKIIKSDEAQETKILTKTYSGSKNSFARKSSRDSFVKTNSNSLENSPREFSNSPREFQFTEVEEITLKQDSSQNTPREVLEPSVRGDPKKFNSMKKILAGLKKLEKTDDSKGSFKETPLKKRHSSATSGASGNSSFSDVGSGEGSPRGGQDVEEVILNEDIEENESKLDELLCQSPLNPSHKLRTKTQGWLDKAKNNTTNENEVWEKKYVIYDINDCIITLSNSKKDIPFKEYQLNKETTLVLYGTDHQKPPRYFIKISLNAGTEYLVLSTKNMDMYWSWMKKFHQSDIQKAELELRDQTLRKNENLDITIHEYRIWKEKQVKEWLKSTLFFFEEKHTTIICDVIEMNGIKGVHLTENFNLKALFGFQSISLDKNIIEEFQKEISINISCLKLDKVFDRNRYIVARKIFKAWPDQFKKNRVHYINLSSNISSPKGLQNYLSSDEGAIKDMFTKLESKNIKDTEFKKVKVKLVITCTTYSPSLRKLISPLLSPLTFINTSYGMFHTALIVGPYYLDWNSSELCVPKRIMKSTESFLSTDISEILVENNDLEGVIKKISEVIATWNTSYTYGSAKIGNARNCQDFVDDILRCLGVNWSPQKGGAFDKFLNSIKKGNQGAKFFASDLFEKRFQDDKSIMNKKRWEFATHDDLDQFCLELQKKCKNIEKEFSEEWTLLKGLDRGFWLKYYGEQSKTPKLQNLFRIDAFAPRDSKKDLKCSCPFGDPKLSGSFR